jgi:hypothetical protein
MDQRLKKALEHADYVTTFKNQKRMLQATYNKECTVYYCGGQFTASREYITSVSTIKCDIFVDNNQTPIEILDKKDFYNTLTEAYTNATEKYYSEYQNLVQSERTVQGILNV